MLAVGQAAASLSSIYENVNNQLTNSLNKIASGKRTYNPTDDFGGYLAAGAIASQQIAVQRDKESIVAAKELTSAGAKFGQQILEQLGKINELTASSVAAGAGSEQDAINAQIAGIVAAVNTAITGTVIGGGQKLSSGTVTAAGVKVGATMAALTADGTQGAVDADIAAATTFMATYQAQDDMLTNLSALSDVIDTAKSNTLSAIQDVNDVKELARVTDLQVRSQASVAMMAQANSTRAGIARLFM